MCPCCIAYNHNCYPTSIFSVNPLHYKRFILTIKVANFVIFLECCASFIQESLYLLSFEFTIYSVWWLTDSNRYCWLIKAWDVSFRTNQTCNQLLLSIYATNTLYLWPFAFTVNFFVSFIHGISTTANLLIGYLVAKYLLGSFDW